MNKKNLRASGVILLIAVAWMISGFFAPGDPEVFEPEAKNQKVIMLAINCNNKRGENCATAKLKVGGTYHNLVRFQQLL